MLDTVVPSVAAVFLALGGGRAAVSAMDRTPGLADPVPTWEDVVTPRGDSRSEQPPPHSPRSLSAFASAPVDIPDPKLRAALNRELGQAADAGITATQMASFTRNIDLRSKEITDLEGIQSAVNAAGLQLADNHLTDLGPLASMTWLLRLDVSRNDIADLGPLTRLTGLGIVNVAQNRVTSLEPLRDTRESLTFLTADDNGIEDLSPLGDLEHLQSLSIDRNAVSDLGPLSSVATLKHLHIDGNLVSTLAPLSVVPDLWSLSADDNPLTSVAPLEGQKRISVLSLLGNRISDLAVVEDLPLLQILDVDEWTPPVDPTEPVVEQPPVATEPTAAKSRTADASHLAATGTVTSWAWPAASALLVLLGTGAMTARRLLRRRAAP